ncbi:MAG: hypothetical protein QOD06_2892 [Candidatus Binatota bacterium]|jgi:crotonobetainyl-CoA:carnitine CoA-transferase CaiB-like acyl-CoA transferase|nr:hypothetical protein [Candidatus Binatota bacterium]
MSSGALTNLRVVELGSGVSAAYATKLFADLGADVVKVELPEGDESRHAGPFPGGVPDARASGLYLYLNANKRGAVLDLRREQGRRDLGRLLARADLVVENFPPPELSALGVEPEALRESRPHLVATSITPFGLSGPHRDHKAYDLNLWNAGGVAYLNGGGPGTDDLPPLATFGHQASFQAGVNAAIGSLGALLARRRTGRGQTVEVSVQECLVTILELTYPFWPYCGLTASRLGAKPIQPLDFFECRDGWIYLCAVEEHQWRSFVAFLGNPEWADLEIFSDRLQRGANWDALQPMIAEWMAEQSVRELYSALQKRRVPVAPVSTMADLLDSEHLNARGFFAVIEHPKGGSLRVPGAPFVLSRTPWRLARPAPELGQHTAEVLGESAAPEE